MTRKKTDSAREFEELMHRPDARKQYVLRLYVSGRKPRSQHAIATLTALCREHLQGRFNLEVIDVDENPRLAQREQIFALPTLVREMPEPLRRFIGDLADTSSILVGLNVTSRSDP
ncbi:MAG TPA: circadian clock KaiB family protein [Candidatus Polarisedimenticolia bacterium]|nr:circadian clock KaiB family protein [Candidatus Polarisedimenticolia bacterium]